MKRKKVLVTGGEGFLGRYLVDYLSKEKNNDVVIFDKLAGIGEKRIAGDILVKEDVEKVFEIYGPFDTVYHLASAMPDKSVTDEITWETSVTGTINLISTAVAKKTRSFIFTSTNVTFGIPLELPVTEKTPVAPVEAYGRSKVKAEQELEKYKNSINIQIFRCPVITGVGRLGLQAILFEFISENKNVYVLGNGDNKYQFVDAMDVVIALELASHVKGFDIYTIGGEGVMTIRELYQGVINGVKSKSKIISLPGGPALRLLAILEKLNVSPLGVYQYSMIGRSMWADTSKIKTKLGWKPQKTNLASFSENYNWYVQNKEKFSVVGSGAMSSNRSLPKMKIFKLLKFLS